MPGVPASLLATLLLAGAPALAREDKAAAPIPEDTLALIAARGSSAGAPMLLRAYKKESEFELWKQGADGRFVHVKTYPICRWSGQLGPKHRAGDRQSPEGIYAVAPGQMNPASGYHLAFNVGYPNAYDRAHGGTGSLVMMHGSCESTGCFAMTNRGARELFAIAREAFAGGQAAFQFQSYPFRMSALNMARYRSDPNIGFWRQLKEGSDRFEATGREPAVSVSAGRYAFQPLGDPEQEALALARIREEAALAQNLAEEGVAAIRTTYVDGDQHAVWREAVAKRTTGVGRVSWPQALTGSAQEIVLVPARRRPAIPEPAWTAAIAAGTAFALPQVAGFVPAYEAAESPCAADDAAHDSARLPFILRESLQGSLAPPALASARRLAAAVARR